MMFHVIIKTSDNNVRSVPRLKHEVLKLLHVWWSLMFIFV